MSGKCSHAKGCIDVVLGLCMMESTCCHARPVSEVNKPGRPGRLPIGHTTTTTRRL
jgi:hypothetical protein